MAVVMGQIVGFKMRVPPTKADPRGNGFKLPANPTDAPALVLKVVSATRLILFVFSFSPFVVRADLFDSLSPRSNTWFLLP